MLLQQENRINKIFENAVIFYFIFSSLFLTLRILLIGSDESVTRFEYLIAMLPEIYITGLICLFGIILYNKNKITKLSFFDKLVIIFIISNIILGIILAGNLKISIYAIRMTYVPMFFYFFIKFGFTFNMEKFESFLKKIINWYIIVALIGIVLYFIFPDFEEYMIKKANGEIQYFVIKRMGSIFWTPVLMGSFMSICMIFYQYKLYKKETLISYLVLMVFWACLFLSVSRGAILVTVIALILLFIIYRKVKVFLKSLGCILVVLSLLIIIQSRVFIIFGWVSSSSIQTFNETQYLMSNKHKIEITRVNFWETSLNDFMKNPIGYGLGKAGHVGNRFFDHSDKTASTYSTDGWYLKLANETGVWGLISYMVLAIVFIIQLFKTWVKEKHSLWAPLIVMFTTISLQNIVSNVNDFYSFSCLFWLLVGVSQNLITSETDAKN